MIGPTADDVRAVMIEGESGVLNIPMRRHERPVYRPSNRRLYWPNGCITRLFSADEPERLRGGQHEFIWADEPGSWRYPDAWDQAMFGLRIGPDPRCIVTGTPRPVTIIKQIHADPLAVITKGSSYDNRANLSPEYYRILARYEGTRLGRQEIEGELLLDIPGAVFLWSSFRRGVPPPLGEFTRVAVALDPAGGDGEDHAEMGLIVAGRHGGGKGWVLADRSLRGTPDEVAKAAWQAFDDFSADVIVVETNNGGDWIPSLLRRERPRGGVVKKVTASRGKRTRAEPIGLEYEQGRWWHAITVDQDGAPLPAAQQPLAALEDQMTSWVPSAGMESPDRMDALVWCATELRVTGEPARSRRRPPDTVPGEKPVRSRMAGVKQKRW